MAADWLPISPVWAGVAISAALLGLFLALREAGMVTSPSSLVFSRDVGFRITISFIVTTGAGIALMPWMERAGLRDLAALRPWLHSSSQEFEALERSLTHFRARSLWLAVLVGVVIHSLMTFAALGFSTAPRFSAQSIFPLASWAVLAPATYVLVSQTAIFRRVAHDLRRIQLFDLRPLAPFSRVGLRTSLFYAALFTIVSGSHEDWSTEGLALPAYIVVAMLIWAPSCLGLAMLPVWGAHRRIQAEKHAELDRINAAIEGAADALAGSPMATHAAELRGVALLDYREKVEAVPEWPFGAAGLQRLALYVLIPPLGWLGGALMERVIDPLLQ